MPGRQEDRERRGGRGDYDSGRRAPGVLSRGRENGWGEEPEPRGVYGLPDRGGEYRGGMDHGMYSEEFFMHEGMFEENPWHLENSQLGEPPAPPKFESEPKESPSNLKKSLLMRKDRVEVQPRVSAIPIIDEAKPQEAAPKLDSPKASVEKIQPVEKQEEKKEEPKAEVIVEVKVEVKQEIPIMPIAQVPQPAPIPEVKVENARPDVFVEIEEFLRVIIEGYFTPEVEEMIAQMYLKREGKNKANEGEKKEEKENPLSSEKKEGEKNEKVEDENRDSKRAQPKAKKAEKVVKKTTPAVPERERTGVVSFWLYKYDVNSNLDEINLEDLKDNTLVVELYESFGSLFSMKECSNAFKFNQQDIVMAAQWLIDEGEKQRGKKSINYVQTTLLCQGEVDPKWLKNKGPKLNTDELVMSQSIIQDRHLNEECIFHKGNILIGTNLYFSSRPSDEYELPTDVFPQIQQDKRFVTPDRSNLAMKFGKQAKDLIEEHPGDNHLKQFLGNMYNLGEQNKGLQNNLFEIMERDAPKEPKRKLRDLSEEEMPELSIDKVVEKKEETEAVKKPEPQGPRKFRGTFICKWTNAIEKQDIQSPRCYQSSTGCLFSLQTTKKNIWMHNPSLIVKYRDPICYDSSFAKNEGYFSDDTFPKVFFDGVLEISHINEPNNEKSFEVQRVKFEELRNEFSEIKTLEELSKKLSTFIKTINIKRFSMPFKTSDMLDSLTKYLSEVETLIGKTTNAEAKKHLQNKKGKIVSKKTRLEKVYAQRRVSYLAEHQTKEEEDAEKEKRPQPTLVENKRHFAFCPIGSLAEMRLLVSQLKTGLEKNNEAAVFKNLEYLNFWSNTMSVNLPTAETKELFSLLMKCIQEGDENSRTSKLIEVIIVRLFYHIWRDTELVHSLVKLAFKRKSVLHDNYKSIREKASKVEHLAVNTAELTLLENLYLLLCRQKNFCSLNPLNAAEVYSINQRGSKSAYKSSEQAPNKSLGLPVSKEGELIPGKEKELFSLLLFMQESIMETPLSLDLLLKWRIFYRHFFDVWLTIEGQSKKEATEGLVSEFVSITLCFIERYMEIVDKDSLKNIELYTVVLEYLVCMVNIITCYLIKTKSSSKIMIDSDFLAIKNLSVMGILMKIFKKVDTLCNGGVSNSLKLNTEGIDTTQENIFETCHPLNRGENVRFNSLNYPHALGVLVQLDKRCSSDQNRDFLSICSWDSDNNHFGSRARLL
jgi:hypothetical protein